MSSHRFVFTILLSYLHRHSALSRASSRYSSKGRLTGGDPDPDTVLRIYLYDVRSEVFAGLTPVPTRKGNLPLIGTLRPGAGTSSTLGLLLGLTKGGLKR